MFSESWSQRRWRLTGLLAEDQQVMLTLNGHEVPVREVAVEALYPEGHLVIVAASGYGDDGRWRYQEFDGGTGYPDALMPAISALLAKVPRWPLNRRYPGGIGCRHAAGRPRLRDGPH